MAVINLKKHEIACKIVYYGPARCGKTTNIEYIHRSHRRQALSELVSIKTDNDRTLFFDFLPVGIGKLRGCDVLLQLYTVPGQIKYSSTRKLVLRGTDAVVFVADSMQVRREHNIHSLKDLHEQLTENNLNILKIPLVMQYNKRDLEGQAVRIMQIETMEHDLNRQLKVPSFPGSALTGKGVEETLNACLKLMLPAIRKELHF
jgi:mutual gliding-motility protein MglA